MAITHPKPTEETPTNHGEGTTPSPEKATKKHGKMFKAGAAGLAALGIAGAAFVAGRGSGESEPQKVTNDAPVAESTTTAPKNIAEQFGLSSSIAGGESINVDYEASGAQSDPLTPEQTKVWETYNTTWATELGESIQKGAVDIAPGTCITSTDTLVDKDGQAFSVLTVRVNPIVKRVSGHNVYLSFGDTNSYDSVILDGNESGEQVGIVGQHGRSKTYEVTSTGRGSDVSASVDGAFNYEESSANNIIRAPFYDSDASSLNPDITWQDTGVLVTPYSSTESVDTEPFMAGIIVTKTAQGEISPSERGEICTALLEASGYKS